jgi:hypothetical protein
LAQVAADKGKLGLERIHPLDETDPFDRLRLKNIATHAIYRIGGVDDNASASQARQYRFQGARGWILRMKLEQHDEKFISGLKRPG